ncbi:MAG: glycosyltransferase family 9 protein [Chthoniobacterales bacterium]|nr:glycosyltransferase family 9 protein [Chthoniobacterales bacterium]
MKLLLIRNDNIGDLACTTPLIEVLRQAYPSVTMDLFCNSYNVDLVRHDPRLTRLWVYQKGGHAPCFMEKLGALIHKAFLLLRLRWEKYDVVIMASPTFNKRTLKLAKWIHPKKILGPENKNGSLPKNYQGVNISPDQHHVLQVLSFASALKISFNPPEQMSLFLSAEEKERAIMERKNLFGTHQLPVLGLQISARRPKQRWDLEQWTSIIKQLIPYASIRLLWSPGSSKNKQHPGDDFLAQELQKLFPTVVALPNKNLRDLMVAFKTCDLVIGSDGGAMHIAAGMDVPTLTLFGDVDPTIWKPYSKKGIALKSPSDSLVDLAPDLVAEKVKSFLGIQARGNK